MRVVLHIGTDKTGSTAIQRHLWINRGWFLDRSIYIPETGLGVGNGHSALLQTLPVDELGQLTRELAGAAQQGHRRALLSWEGMNFYRRRDIRRLRAALANMDVSILLYVREQAQIIQSGFLQELKSNAIHGTMQALDRPRTPLDRVRSRRRCFSAKRDYYRLLRRWQNLLPQASFLVRPFDRAQLQNADVVDDFLSALDLSVDGDFQRLGSASNPSLDVESALAVQSWQASGLAEEDMLRRLDIAGSVLARDGLATRYFLSREVVAKIRKHFLASNARLAAQFMGRSDDPFAGQGDCCRERSFDSLRDDAEAFSLKVATIDRVPTLMAPLKGAALRPLLSADNGWSSPSVWGGWSEGAESQLRFRMPHRRMPADCGGVCVILRGRYFGDNRETRVSINGTDYGLQRLAKGHPGLFLPAEALQAYENIEVTLRHQRPTSPRQLGSGEDDRPLAFGLERLRCVYLDRERAEAFQSTV